MLENSFNSQFFFGMKSRLIGKTHKTNGKKMAERFYIFSYLCFAFLFYFIHLTDNTYKSTMKAMVMPTLNEIYVSKQSEKGKKNFKLPNAGVRFVEWKIPWVNNKKRETDQKKWNKIIIIKTKTKKVKKIKWIKKRNSLASELILR